MSQIPFGGPGEIPPVPETCPNDRFENTIREIGVVNACEWFGYQADDAFTLETIDILRARSAGEKR
ncbi:hypothetical protein [Burkholderia gladioli]|uniref:Uncharacterized protein n=1 Tax=Burkholderia gladioli TaxID=28095 RepID=A0AB38TMB6_BURGA|nr:hypothetical protein [Burkholderia gladioli]UWX68858.1 hypothetical protein NYZ96_11475 [Burkholderia gladioli]UWX75338.1 hypothetical protein NYZ96_35235 [Burkholderia gladioli]